MLLTAAGYVVSVTQVTLPLPSRNPYAWNLSTQIAEQKEKIIQESRDEYKNIRYMIAQS